MGSDITQTLRLDYFSAEAETKTITIALDIPDLEQFKKCCEDALQKAEVARNLVESGGLESPSRIVVHQHVSIEITISRKTTGNNAQQEHQDAGVGYIEWNPKNWNKYDFSGAFGVALMLVGLIFAFLPSMHTYGILFPVGVILITFAAYGARRNDAYPS